MGASTPTTLRASAITASMPSLRTSCHTEMGGDGQGEEMWEEERGGAGYSYRVHAEGTGYRAQGARYRTHGTGCAGYRVQGCIQFGTSIQMIFIPDSSEYFHPSAEF